MSADVVSHPAPHLTRIAAVIVFAVLLWLLVAFALVFIVPKCQKVYNDNKRRIPYATECAFRLTSWSHRQWPVAILVALAMHVVATAAYRFSRRELRARWLGRAWWAFVLLPPVAVLGAIALTMCLPLWL